MGGCDSDDGMSWRKRLNSVGNRTEPSGTPSLKDRIFDGMPLKLT